ncbi:MAG TPA: sulfatase [Polyangiaceae bacterium]|nr:sulfatase [Polyangiaceae bacterium]
MRRTFLAGVPALCTALACGRGAPSGGPTEAPPEKAPLAPAIRVALSAPVTVAPAPVPKGPAGPLNVILLTIDSLRQDMPWAGYEKPIAPNLTKLAAESVVYTHAYSVSSYTAKSVAAFLAGRYPSSLYRSGVFFTSYSKSNTFLAEVLSEHGVRTIGLQAHAYFKRGNQLDQGFDVWEVVPGISFDPTTDKNVTSDKMTDLAVKVLGNTENTGKPFFAWLHYMDPHDQYMLHAEAPDFGKGNRARYDSEVFYTDLHVGRLLEFLKKQPWWEKTALIVSADHGEAFGEHGVYRHAFWLWDVLTRVPLFVHAPGAAPARIDQKRSHVDLAPTVTDLLGVRPAPEAFVGRSLVPEIYGAEKPADRDPILLDLPVDSHNPEIFAVLSGNLKLIVYDHVRYELYDLAADPGELHDLAKEKPEDLARMKVLYEKEHGAIPVIAPYGGNKLHDGKTANGPMGPSK